MRSALKLALGVLALLASSASFAQQDAQGSTQVPIEAWFYLGRVNEAGAWTPAARSLRLDSAKDPKRVTVVRDTVLVDRLDADPAAKPGDPALADWTRVVRRGSQPVPLLELVRHDSVGKGKLVWAKVRVPEERVEVRTWR
jgi:hypothetical protein